MIELARGLSFVRYKYEGGPLRFTVTFPYLKQEHVRVLVGDPASPRFVLGKWINATTVEIPDQTPHLTAPYTVALRRVTPIADLAIEYQGGAMLPESHLNTSLKQLLFAQQENREFPGGGAGSPGGGDNSLIDIQTLIDLVTQSPAFLILQEKIPDVDANAELIIEELLRSNTFFDLHRDHGDKINTAYTRISLTEDATQALAEQYTELFTRIVTSESSIAAQFLQVNQAVVTERNARVSSMTDLHAQITTERDTYVAQAVSNVTALVDAVESRVDSVEGTVATHGDSIAATNEALTTVANAGGANTTWRQLFSAQFGGDGASGTSVAAAVKQQIDTKVTPTEAQSIANSSVTAFANGTFAALQQSYNAYVNSNDAKWSGTWSLRINGGDPANPIIAGIALSANPSGSDFVVQADRFAIVSPTNYGVRRVPFVVGNVGGVSTVGITGALLVDGSVTAGKITANSLSAITANAGTINGGTFKTHSLDANGNVLDPAEFRVEVSNVGNWPLWVGSGAKNENNAVFWLDRWGNAAFRGKVSAPNIVGQFQSAAAINWTGATTIGQDYTEVLQFQLGAPVLVGEAHTPVLSLTVSCTPGMPGPDVIVQEARGSVWVEIGRTDVAYYESYYMVQGGEGNAFYRIRSPLRNTNVTVNAVGQPTASPRAFRVIARWRQVIYLAAGGGDTSALYTGATNITAISGSVFGIR
ncbi:Phage host specificity protein J [Lysobacter capsici AZ78]|uniref:Phage host specificity protein J n=1 Tax=Lysobacter capsici AZ78 TaxID=1444315 RepID=A0A125MML1_9GAMM|nr:phage tail fiber protein [Lysobacter capsici]KWS03756.1 Phage host specificity protein J [Lysobacter capsici AZ78]